MNIKNIILIGNGFDLHFKLPTSYNHFEKYISQHFPREKSLVESFYKMDSKQLSLWSNFEASIANVDKDFFEAAQTLGASKRQMVFRVAIPHAMPSILQGCTQAMSSSCVALMIAEMLGVKSGLGWYMTWQSGWASYDKMFAALFVICLIFTIVTKCLERVKRHVLRWQNGGEK